jgi:hypothetical protein
VLHIRLPNTGTENLYTAKGHLFMEKSNKPKLDDIANEFLDGENLKMAFEFIAYLKNVRIP